MGLPLLFHRNINMSSPRRSPRRILGFDSLEDRLVLTVTLAPIAPPPVLLSKHTYVPLVATDTDNLPITFSATSADSNIQAAIYTAGRTLTLNVSGKDQNGNDFTGNVVLKLFEDKAPQTTARIIQLAQSGFYNGLTFHRVVKGFVAQGGDPNGDGTGGSGTKLDDEFNASLTFNSFGLLAMANSGDDTSDSQFFITDTDSSSVFHPDLNFDYTIFGQIVDGLDIFQKIMNTPVTGEKPVTDVVINTATVATTNRYAILDLSAIAAVTTPANVTITASNSQGDSDTTVGTVTATEDTHNDRPFLNSISSNVQLIRNTPYEFTVSATDLENDPLTFYVVRPDLSDLTSTDNVSVTITPLSNTSAKITITPKPDFLGDVSLKLVVDQTDLQYDIQAFKVTVVNDPTSPTSITLVSGTGVSAGNTVNFDTPTVEIKAPTGQIVKVLVGGTQVGTATETSTAGTYRYTFTAANKLLLGTNTVTAVTSISGVDSPPSVALSVYFAPNMQQVYIVPGAAGEQVSLRFDFLAATTGYKNELGYYVVDDMAGKVHGVAPTASNYWSTVSTYGNRKVIFSFQAGGSRAAKTITLAAGTRVVFYLSVNSAFNATKPNSLFSTLKATNKDNLFHADNFTDRTGNRAIYGFEDTFKGGDRDFDDMVFSVRQSSTTPAVGALAVDAAAAGQTVKTSFALLPGTGLKAKIGGEVGIFPVLDALGTINAPTASDPNRQLKPGDAGYAQAALSQTGKQVLFTNGYVPAETTRSINQTAGTFFGVYYIPRGTVASWLTSNSANAIKVNAPIAYFSFAAANPDSGKEHMRSYGRSGTPRTQAGLFPVANDPVRLHLMGTANGTTNNFSDFILSYSQTAV